MMREINNSQKIDVVDDHNQVIDSIERKLLLKRGLNFRVVHVILRNEKNELLLQQLSNAHLRNSLSWGSSAAGFVHSGESTDEAVKRVLLDELGRPIAVKNRVTFSMTDQKSKKFVTIYDGIISSMPKPDQSQINALKFVAYEKIISSLKQRPQNLTPTFIEVFNRYRKVTCV
jgi:isopentenyldiphosphate isomerase